MTISLNKKLLFVTTLGLAFIVSHAQNAQRIWSWGDNSYGQLGYGTYTASAIPTKVVSANNWRVVSGGGNHTLAIKTDGTVWAWGYNSEGELGNGTFSTTTPYGTNLPGQVPGLSNFVDVAGGGYHSIALKNDGTVWTWGKNDKGQLGNGTITTTSPNGNASPAIVPGFTNLQAIAAGLNHSIALSFDGTVYSWGSNNLGQLGDGTQIDRPSPVLVANLSNVIAIAVGNYHSVALKSDGTVWTWGYGQSGQLGNGAFNDSYVPIKVNSLSDIVAIACGYKHCLAIKRDGTVWAWGYNYVGDLGFGTFTTNSPFGISLPAQVPGLSYTTNIASKGDHCLALQIDGSVKSWGYNKYGQLGNGTFTSTSPYGISNAALVNGLSNVCSISAGANGSLAITANSYIFVNVTVVLQSWGGSSMPVAYVSVDGTKRQWAAVTQTGQNTGTFSLRMVTAGSHTINVKIKGYLAQKLTVNIVGTSAAVTFNGPGGVGMLCGDTNDNGLIDDTDLLTIINYFYGSGPTGDVNGDGLVDDTDLLNAINNFLAVGDL